MVILSGHPAFCLSSGFIVELESLRDDTMIYRVSTNFDWEDIWQVF
jgi:hypothetical protein